MVIRDALGSRVLYLVYVVVDRDIGRTSWVAWSRSFLVAITLGFTRVAHPRGITAIGEFLCLQTVMMQS